MALTEPTGALAVAPARAVLSFAAPASPLKALAPWTTLAYPHHHPHPAPHRRHSELGLQPRLGLRAERDHRRDPADPHHPDAAGPLADLSRAARPAGSQAEQDRDLLGAGGRRHLA